MNEYFELDSCERSISPSPGELLYRQVPEHYWDPIAGKPSSAAFGPATIDGGMPSFSRSKKVTAQGSRDWHQHNARSHSHGVWACTVEEVDAADTRSVDDSDCPSPPRKPRSPGHCYVDYRHFGKRGERIVRASLLAAALERGEIPTKECQRCLRLSELGPEEAGVLRARVEKWVSANGCSPSRDSDDPLEQLYAETLVHMQSKWRDYAVESAYHEL